MTKSKDVAYGKPLNYNAGIQLKYSKQLISLVRQMVGQTETKILKLFDQPVATEFFATDETVSAQAKILMNELYKKFDALFAYKSKKLADDMMKQTEKYSSGSLKTSLETLSEGVTIKTNVMTGPLKEVIAAGISENVSLIRSISEKYLNQVEGAVMRSITTGNGLQTLVPALKKYKGMTVERARTIAYDQTRKAYNTINKTRMQSIGTNKFEWLHTAGSQHPRKLHEQLSGQIFSFDDPPIIDEKTGERGIPGQLPNCRCRMLPVIDYKAKDDT